MTRETTYPIYDLVENKLNIQHITSDDVLPGHKYQISNGESWLDTIEFQRGAIAENGVNGVTSEVLIEILIHRTNALNAQLPCPENEKVVSALLSALDALEERRKNNRGRTIPMPDVEVEGE